MYQEFYNLKDTPFRLTPDPDFLCMTAQHREALAGLVFSVCTRPGLTVLVGEAGTGKTTLLYSLVELLEKRRFVTALCTNPTLTREEFYDLLMLKFGIECPPMKSRQLMALQEALVRNRKDNRPSVLIVDEAQRLSPEILEEVRLLLNMETPREKLLQIIVAGQPELSEVLHRTEMRQLKQRISCLCKLHPLTMEELREYLHHRLTQAGLAQQTLFPENTIELIHSYTQGIPRLVNSLCDSALQTGFGLQAKRITPAIIEEAANDLELTPASRLPKALADIKFPIPDVKIPIPEPQVIKEVPAKTNGHAKGVEVKVPLETYTNRQRSLGFLTSLVERWR